MVVSPMISNLGYQLKKNSPQILTVTGIVTGLAGTIWACWATTKATEIVKDAKEDIDEIQAKLEEETARDSATEFTPEVAKAERRKVYLRTTSKLLKVYAGPVGLGITAGVCVLGANHVLNERNTALAATLAVTTSGFNEYRNGLIKKLGEKGKELDRELRNAGEEVEIKEEIEDENGKKKTVKRKVKLVDANNKPLECDYRRVFDWHNPYYKPSMVYIMTFLRGRQSYFNTYLMAHGYLFWNDVLTECGFPKCEPGQIVGWRSDKEGDANSDGRVNFRLEEAYMDDEDGVRRPVVLIDYNCDGSILNKIDWDRNKWELC